MFGNQHEVCDYRIIYKRKHYKSPLKKKKKDFNLKNNLMCLNFTSMHND